MTDSVSTNLARWQLQKAQRLQLGDVLETPRPVDQNAFFRNAKSAGRAAETLREHGFVVTPSRSLFRSELLATRDESLTDESVESFLKIVISIVESNGGTYDGFGGGVAK